MTAPLLSILVPTYNRAGYLRECLASLLATEVPCEVIVGDNASADDTPQVVAAFDDPRVRYHRHERNLGPIANFNFLLGQARGTYVCMFGDDDMSLPGNFETKVGLLERHPELALVYSRNAAMDQAGLPVAAQPVMGLLAHGYVGGRDEFQELLVNCYLPWQTMVFRRALLAEVGDLDDGWGLEASHDWYWLQLLVRGRQTAYFNAAMVTVRFHPGAFTTREAHAKGMFGKDRFLIWRRWLLDHPQPPVVTEAIWERMVAAVAEDLRLAGPDPARREAALRALTELKLLYRRRMEARVATELAVPDPYVPEARPWPLEGLRRRSFAYVAAWGTQECVEVLQAYAAAFTAADDATLVLVLDPRQGVDEARAADLILAALAGVASVPDLLLVPEPAGDAQFARVFAAVHAVVAPNLPERAAQARRMGKAVLTDLAPAAWRR